MALLDALSNIYGNGGAGDPLISIGMGLLSQRGLGPGLAQGFQNAATMSQLSNARNRQAALDKLAQERESRQAANDRLTQEWREKQFAASQANHAESIGLQREQMNRPSLVDVPQADGTVQKQWISPGGAPGATVGAPVAAGNVNRDVASREAELKRMGMDPKDPRNQQYMLTGKFPREDAQPLTPTDKKAILEADEGVSAATSAIDALGEAKKLSPQAYGGFGAGLRGQLGANLPDYLVPDFIASPQAGEATQNLDNLLGQNALSQLKTIFGSAPTEGERQILLDLQGSSNKSDKVRQDIYERAIKLANIRLNLNKTRADQLRGGTFYAPKTAPSAAPDAPAPSISYPSWSIEK